MKWSVSQGLEVVSVDKYSFEDKNLKKLKIITSTNIQHMYI
jgi:hypothetical protein